MAPQQDCGTAAKVVLIRKRVKFAPDPFGQRKDHRVFILLSVILALALSLPFRQPSTDHPTRDGFALWPLALGGAGREYTTGFT